MPHPFFGAKDVCYRNRVAWAFSKAQGLAFIGIFQFQLRAWPFVASTREKLHLAEKNRPLKWPFRVGPSSAPRRYEWLRAASSRLAMRDGATMSLSLSAGDASGGCGRAFGASAPADCCAVWCCQRQRAGAIGDWCVAARGPLWRGSRGCLAGVVVARA